MDSYRDRFIRRCIRYRINSRDASHPQGNWFRKSAKLKSKFISQRYRGWQPRPSLHWNCIFHELHSCLQSEAKAPAFILASVAWCVRVCEKWKIGPTRREPPSVSHWIRFRLSMRTQLNSPFDVCCIRCTVPPSCADRELQEKELRGSWRGRHVDGATVAEPSKPRKSASRAER